MKDRKESRQTRIQHVLMFNFLRSLTPVPLPTQKQTTADQADLMRRLQSDQFSIKATMLEWTEISLERKGKVRILLMGFILSRSLEISNIL